MEVTFDFEGCLDESCAFFALYAGLRIYKEKKEREPHDIGTLSIAALEAGFMLEQLKEQYEQKYWEAVAEYEHVYK